MMRSPTRHMTHPEQQHIDIIAEILSNGDRHDGRNGGYRGLFMRSMKFDMSPGDDHSISLPVSTVAGTYLRGVIEEFKSFFVRGESDSKLLEKVGVGVWKDNTRMTNGVIGPAYGHNYRNYGGGYSPDGSGKDGVDQVARLVDEALSNPSSRRLIIVNTNPSVNDECVLHPCQILFQVYLCRDGGDDGGRYRLDVHAYNRSSDIACAGMWNTAFASLVAAYIAALLTARGMNTTPRMVYMTLGNVHVYENQVPTAIEHITRKPTGTFPRVIVTADGDVEVIKKTVTEYSGLRYPMNV
jgi:thymidylate synthase